MRGEEKYRRVARGRHPRVGTAIAFIGWPFLLLAATRWRMEMLPTAHLRPISFPCASAAFLFFFFSLLLFFRFSPILSSLYLFYFSFFHLFFFGYTISCNICPCLLRLILCKKYIGMILLCIINVTLTLDLAVE